MKFKFNKVFGYKTICVVIILFLTLHLWIGGYVFKFSSEEDARDSPSVIKRDMLPTGVQFYTEKNLDYQPRRFPDWEERSLLSNSTNKTLLAFRQVLSKEEFKTLLEILRTFKIQCKKNNLTYMLYGGSAFGALRHAGLIPWDDDVDVWMDVRQKTVISNVFGNLPGYKLYKDKPNLWKIMSNDSKLNRWDDCKNELFPFVHIIFYQDNYTHICEIDGPLTSITVFPRSDIFPLKKVRFEDDFYYAPNDVIAMMTRRYGRVDLCTPRTCSNSPISVPCDLLFPYFPFIKRYKENNSLIERLYFDKKIYWEKISN